MPLTPCLQILQFGSAPARLSTKWSRLGRSQALSYPTTAVLLWGTADPARGGVTRAQTSVWPGTWATVKLLSAHESLSEIEDWGWRAQ